MSMKISLALLAVLFFEGVKAQQITGAWLSADSSRVYMIRQTGNNAYEAVIKSSTRKTDTAGFAVIKSLYYNAAKKRYEGIMYAVNDNRPCLVKITAAGSRLQLKLQRMFLFNAVLQWNRAADAVAASAN